jgi:hypothetical protein
MEASMITITPHEILLAVGLACAGSGWFAHMAWNGFQNWLDDRAEARTPEGRAALLAEREDDRAWEVSQRDAEDTLTALAAQQAVPAATGPLRHAEGRTAAMAGLSPAVLAAEHEAGLKNAEARRLAAVQAADPLYQALEAQRRELEPLPQAHPGYAGSDDRFTDGTGPQDAVAAEISGVGAMVAVPRERRERIGPDTAEIAAVTGAQEWQDGISARARVADAAAEERSKWAFMPVRMGTPPHGYPIMTGDSGGQTYVNPGPWHGGNGAPALEALDWDSRRLSALLAKADRVTGPKADWDLLARQCSRELAHA